MRRAHGALAALAAPALRWHLRRRAAQGKEEAARLPEREGSSAARPPGRLLWLHGASVGESLSLLPVVEALARRDRELEFLVTTGTVTAATLLPSRWPEAAAGRIRHRYAPLDVPGWVARFLDGWRPDAAVFAESELWPNTLAALRARGIPSVLANARFSARSARRWRRVAPATLREMLAGHAAVWPQSEADAARLAAAGAVSPRPLGNLKWAAPPLPADPAALAALRDAIGTRPVFLAASTHPGEEGLAIAAHRRLSLRHSGLLTILAPRHPERGEEVAALAAAAGLAHRRRSRGALPQPGDAIHVADTMGELGLLYRVAGCALVGRSLLPHPGGGQNPLEPARLGCPVLIGPHHWNQAEATAALLAGGAARLVAEPDPDALAEAAEAALGNAAMGEAGRRIAEDSSRAAERVADALLEVLGRDVRSRNGPGTPARA
ncbi:MAG: 3-deoxy-D-manno-octulosonic acid transferase [Acetobacteraceae bacterium]|nr:3-deoxy-D-manno-octulosonic acid transferase [Acetobacteraceae bacterium]